MLLCSGRGNTRKRCTNCFFCTRILMEIRKFSRINGIFVSSRFHDFLHQQWRNMKCRILIHDSYLVASLIDDLESKRLLRKRKCKKKIWNETKNQWIQATKTPNKWDAGICQITQATNQTNDKFHTHVHTHSRHSKHTRMPNKKQDTKEKPTQFNIKSTTC